MDINGNLSRREFLKQSVGAALSGAAFGFCLPAQAAKLNPEMLLAQRLPDFSDRKPKIALGDGHLLIALALMLDDPVSLLAGWHGDLKIRSQGLYETYKRLKPELENVPVLGQATPQSFSVEHALATKPDILILGGCYGPGATDLHLIEKFKSAGIPVVIVDFYSDPLMNTAPSLKILGDILGGEARQRAHAFADLHQSRVQTIMNKVAPLAKKAPRVLLEGNAAMPGWGCCWVPGQQGLGRFIKAAGGINIAAQIAPDKKWLKAEKEFVLTSKPDIYVASGGPYLRGTSGLVIGPGISQEDAVKSLHSAASASQTRIAATMPHDRVHGVWRLFHATPVNLLVLEAFAKWFNPGIFDDDESALSLDVLNRSYLSLPLEGCFTASLDTAS